MLHRPTAHPPAAAAMIVDSHFSGGEQRRSGAAVCAVRQPGGEAELVGGQAFDVAVLVGERCKRGQEQPGWSPGRAIPENGLEQLRVDVALVPRTGLREQDLHRARVSAANARRFDFE
jgi:hypothetical protein